MASNTNSDAAPVDAKQRRSRSPSYPADGLETAFRNARKIYDSEKRSSTADIVAVKLIGYSSMSGASRVALTSMKKFGLVVEDGDAVRVSDDTVKLIHDPNEATRLELFRKLAQKPDIIREMLSEHPDGLPSDDTLRYKLISDRGFGEDAANTFIKSLRETVRFARLEPGQFTPTAKDEPVEAVIQEQVKRHDGAKQPLPPLAPTPGGKLHVWSLGSVTVEMRTSGPLSSRQVERLRKYVDLAMDAETDEQASSSPEPSPPGQD